MMTLLLLLGCPPSPVDTGGGKEPTDTAADTNADSAGESDSVPVDTAYQPNCDRNLPWKYVAAGLGQTCGIHTDGCAECWGIGREEDNPDDWEWEAGYQWEAEDRPPAGAYTSISMPVNSAHGSAQHACGLLEGGIAVCWGQDEMGETEVVDGSYVALDVNEYATYAVGNDGTVTTWGVAAPPVLTDVTAIHTEEYYGLTLHVDGTLSQWYANAPSSPESVPTLEGVYRAADIASFACAISADGAIDCWAPQDLDWVEDPDMSLFQPPTGDFVDICIEDVAVACALDSVGQVACWGDLLELADPPQPVGVTFTQIACGYSHACGLTAEGEIVCWGYNGYGQCDVPTP